MNDGSVNLEAFIENYLPYFFSLQFFLGSLLFLDAWRVVYYPMIHRKTEIMRFGLSINLVWPLMLLLVFWMGWVIWKRRYRLALFHAVTLFALPFYGLKATISILSLECVVAGLWSQRNRSRFLIGTLILLSGVEGMALLHWIVFIPFGLVSPFGGVAWIETGLFYLATYLVPLLVLPLLFMWLMIPLRHWIGFKVPEGPRVEGAKTISKKVFLMLVFTIFLGVIVALYPYGSVVNPEKKNVGVDFIYYTTWVEKMEADTFQAFIVSDGSRPLTLLVIFGFQQLFGLGVSNAVKYIPVLLIPFLGVSAFFFTFESFNNVEISSWAAFFTVCGIQVTTGMYSYFLSNWLGLSLIFLSFGFLFRAIKIEDCSSLVIASILGGLVVFTHPWTFDQYIATTFVMAGILFFYFRRLGRDLKKLRKIFVYLISVCISDFVKVFLFHGVGGVSATSWATSRIVGLPIFWFKSIFSFRFLYGGTLSMTLLIALAVIGVFYISQRDVPGIYFTTFLTLTSLLFLIGNETIKGRLIFNVPIGVFSAIGSHRLIQTISKNVRKPFVIFMILSMATNTFRTLANIF